ncbi:hypothetical protein BU17DRAFT_50001 [Hysterangium stoloniferum]|nr:hypothetical protein BU17DRAFT_50001 [Hysterangium stoloniferum]
MPWPAHILRKSDRLRDNETIENKFYPLYNSILNECFPQERFSICPQYATPIAQAGGIGAIGFAVTYVVEALDLDSVVFFLEIKPPTHLPILSGRKDADNQMRQRFGQIAHLVKLPTLYGISAIGKSLCYYTYSVPTHTIEPTRILDSCTLLVDTAPIERWDSNIMGEEGHDKFLAMVQDIQSMINTLC